MMPVQTPGPNQDMQPAQVDTSAVRSTAVRSTAVRINVRQLAQLVLFSLFLPGGLAIALDFLLGIFPLLTLVTVVVVIPTASFFVIRSTLREMKSVIDQVAPEEELDQETPEAQESEIFAPEKPERDVAADLHVALMPREPVETDLAGLSKNKK